MDLVTILLIIVALGLIAAFAYVKVRERREDDHGSAPARTSTAPRESTVVDDVIDEEDDDVDALDDLLVKRPASSTWLEDIAVRDDDALAGLEGLTDAEVAESDDVDTVEVVADDAYDLDTTTVDEEFESLTADLEVGIDDETDTPVIVKEEVETADDIMANSKATEINPAGNTELQNLLSKVQARLAQYE